MNKIKSLLLVIHGYDDPRVSINESIELVKKLKVSNTKVTNFVLRNEGHGFSNKRNQLNAHENIYLFDEIIKSTCSIL